MANIKNSKQNAQPSLQPQKHAASTGQLFRRFAHPLVEPLKGIRAIYYDPYNECDNEKETINGVQYLVRPLTKGNDGKSQLSVPSDLDSEYKDCKLYSVVAWDHVSWPGNDYYAGARSTDDGVKAAATDSMKHITGIEGAYDNRSFKYLPPKYQGRNILID